MLRRTILTVTSVAAVLCMTACSQIGSGTPEPESTSDSATPSATDSALKVDKPKNLKSVADTCTLLTPEQLTQLGQDGAPTPQQTAYGQPKCNWFSGKFSITVTPNTTTGNGPEQIYKDAKSNDNFAPTKVEGYPAARVDKQETQCRVEVGTAETESFAVDYYKNAGGTPEMEDPCGYAEKVAAEILKNIPDA